MHAPNYEPLWKLRNHKRNLEDKTAIEKIIKRPVRGMALPNGAGNKLITSIAADLGIKYIRPAADQYAAVKSALEYADCCEGPILLGDENGFSMPSDYMNWIPTCHHNHNLVEFGKRFMALTKKAVSLYDVCMGSQL